MSAESPTAANFIASGERGLQAARPAKRRGTLIYSLTGVCFLFGGVLAAQLRAVERVRENRQAQAKTTVVEAQQARAAKVQFEAEARKSAQQSALLREQLAKIRSQVATGSLSSQRQAKLLNEQILSLQAAAGLTPVTGRGVVMTVDDHPDAAKFSQGSFLPGMVHDFDLLQIVNELRSVKADAIAINGVRITGYTPIRCVGPTVLINWEPVTPPFRIEAVGNASNLEAALKLPQGIVDNLTHPPDGGLPLRIRIARENRLSLPAAEGVPRLKVSHAGSAGALAKAP